MKTTFIAIAALFFLFPMHKISAQPALNGKIIDSWNLDKSLMQRSYNQASVYIYVLNESEFRELFSGISYEREERRELGISANDKPDFLYMSIEIPKALVSTKQDLKVPMMLYDVRKGGATPEFNNFSSFGGKYLNNIDVEGLSASVFGKVYMKALISNSNKQFWKGLASVVSDIGLSATSLLSGNPTELTSQVTNLVKSGMKELENVGDETKSSVNSFFVELIDDTKLDSYNEIVTACRLYQVHWDNVVPGNKDIFTFSEKALDTNLTAKDINNKISISDTPLILIVETRSEYDINLGNTELTRDYYNKIKNGWHSIRQSSKREMAREFVTIFNTAMEAKEKIAAFKIEQSKGIIDKSQLARIIDGYYTFRRSVDIQKEKFQSNGVENTIKEHFENEYLIRYEDISLKLESLLSDTENTNYLIKTEKLVKALISYSDSRAGTLTAQNLYNEIKQLAFYRDLIADMNSDNISTDKFVKNSSYEVNASAISEYEKKLYSKEVPSSEKDDTTKKSIWESILADYKACQYCTSESLNHIQELQGKDLASARGEYDNLVTDEWNNFRTCKDSLFLLFDGNQLVDSIKSNQVFPPKTQQTFLDFRQEFLTNYDTYESNFNKSTEDVSRSVILFWIKKIKEAKFNMLDLADKFKQDSLLVIPTICQGG